MSAPNSFDPSRAYVQQEEVFFNDGREAQLLRHVQSRKDIESLRGCPQKILDAIDEFARQEKFLMNVGAYKGSIVTRLIHETRPKVMVELGSYVGYSAILFGDAARAAGGQEYHCLESNDEFASIVRAFLALAGLSSFVKVTVGPSSDSIRALHDAGQLSQMDFLFLDHYKPAYLPDLQLCEELGLIQKGTVIAADNVIKPGNPPYLAYVRSDVESKRRAYALAGTATGSALRGNPDLVYQSELMESFEPTGMRDGVEVTICVGLDESVS
ncbi:catechol O-methyltransferase [Cordyceps fumosorosea ARSEF 2679]|uniref:catechol O-methyltransferase n=1 Tax=Cordyceps fumosorosea (strain ARSEF 2679) TaxID=1081104 RepID=A0A162KFN9_CORFA|nr:catechol O-methyltransferase [Cordyceps fumosorosea ARSEF 2679]OAA74238.1 catechol O-methyltransferase [Cordyceps fumosorosea ARSEF 2679]